MRDWDASYAMRMLLVGTVATRRRVSRLSNNVGPLAMGWRGVKSTCCPSDCTMGAVVGEGASVAVGGGGTVGSSVATLVAVATSAVGAATVAVASDAVPVVSVVVCGVFPQATNTDIPMRRCAKRLFMGVLSR